MSRYVYFVTEHRNRSFNGGKYTLVLQGHGKGTAGIVLDQRGQPVVPGYRTHLTCDGERSALVEVVGSDGFKNARSDDGKYNRIKINDDTYLYFGVADFEVVYDKEGRLSSGSADYIKTKVSRLTGLDLNESQPRSGS